MTDCLRKRTITRMKGRMDSVQCQLIHINARPDIKSDMGSLCFFEGKRDVPFEIKRVYYISGVKRGNVRGHHAHKTLQQLLFCPYGKIQIHLDDGNEATDALLDEPSKGLFVGPGIWHTMEWLTDDAVLCVCASDYYSEDDYLRDYDDFIRWMSKRCDADEG